MYGEKWARIAAVLIFIGFNLTFFPQFIMGQKGMPRRYFNYPPEFQAYHVLSTMGAYLLGIAFTIMLFYLLKSLVRGERAPGNPWGGASLEWQSPSPPPVENFVGEPRVMDPYDYRDLVYDAATRNYVLRGA